METTKVTYTKANFSNREITLPIVGKVKFDDKNCFDTTSEVAKQLFAMQNSPFAEFGKQNTSAPKKVTDKNKPIITEPKIGEIAGAQKQTTPPSIDDEDTQNIGGDMTDEEKAAQIQALKQAKINEVKSMVENAGKMEDLKNICVTMNIAEAEYSNLKSKAKLKDFILSKLEA